ncbi:MAG: prepilin-type N-terminal cleavage/methylation domain-containing protein [Candidatus Binatia bacterium]
MKRGFPRARSPADGVCGFSILELVAAIAVSAIVATSVVAGARAAGDAARLESARLITALAALASRRAAYTTERVVRLEALPGTTTLTATVQDTDVRAFELPTGTYVAAATSGGRVRFHPGGHATNATITLAGSSTGTATVVINQRGLIR